MSQLKVNAVKVYNGTALTIAEAATTSTVAGNTVLGSSASNTVNIVADINSNVTPDGDGTRSLGVASDRWDVNSKDLAVLQVLNYTSQDITFNTTEDIIFTQSTGKFIGVGTTSPASDIHINRSRASITLSDTSQGQSNDDQKLESFAGALIVTSRDGNANGEVIFKRYNGTTTSETMRLTNTGFVGIGTDSPNQMLHVTGNSEIDGNLVVDGNLTVNGSTTTIESTTLTVDDHQIEIGTVASPTDTTANDGGIVLKGATDKSILWKNSTSRWTFNNGIHADVGTSVFDEAVAIGTATHSTKENTLLTVSSNMELGNAGGGVNLYYNTNALYFSHTSTGINAAIIGGKMRVGTHSDSAPSKQFEVVGDASVSTDLTVGDDLFMGSDASVINFGATADNVKLTHINNAGLQLTTAQSKTQLQIDNTATDGDSTLSFSLGGTDKFTLGVADGDSDKFKIGTADIDTATRLTIDSSGNVGINNSSPAQVFEISGHSNAAATFSLTSYSTNEGKRANISLRHSNSNTVGTNTAVDSGDDLGAISFEGYDANSEYQPGAQIVAEAQATFSTSTAQTDLMFKTCTTDSTTLTERMRIAANGNVGIGTSTPETTLHVQKGTAGTIAAVDNAVMILESSEKPRLQFQSPNAYGGTIVFGSVADNDEGQIDYDHGSDRFLFKTGGSTKMTILGSNVGIGVTDPDTSLEVLSTSTQLKLSYDADSFATMTVDSSSNLTIATGESGIITMSDVLALPDGSASAPSLTNTGDTNCGLFFSAADTLAFTAGGTAQVTFADGVIAPVTTNDVDLGTSSLRFANVYTMDLHLANDRGDWTIIEEEDYLSIRNNKNGKLFKIVMQEISEE
jgi:hypothetical protein